jgi:hypothetical protein
MTNSTILFFDKSICGLGTKGFGTRGPVFFPMTPEHHL